MISGVEGTDMVTFVISFIFFATNALLLMLMQRLRKAPLPAGCTPENCCRVAGNFTACAKVSADHSPPTGSGHDLAKET